MCMEAGRCLALSFHIDLVLERMPRSVIHGGWEVFGFVIPH